MAFPHLRRMEFLKRGRREVGGMEASFLSLLIRILQCREYMTMEITCKATDYF